MQIPGFPLHVESETPLINFDLGVATDNDRGPPQRRTELLSRKAGTGIVKSRNLFLVDHCARRQSNLDLIHQANSRTSTLGIFSGSFNPPTRAHLALARAALNFVDEVLFVLPRAFPHKCYEGATLEQRRDMLLQAIQSDRRFSLGISDGGLFIDIARECRAVYGKLDLWFLCGRDAAERIIHWDYGSQEAFPKMLDEFGLLVARRQGIYQPPPHWADRIRELPVTGVEDVSSSEVRERIRTGGDWQPLVPDNLAPVIERLYS